MPDSTIYVSISVILRVKEGEQTSGEKSDCIIITMRNNERENIKMRTGKKRNNDRARIKKSIN